MDYPVRKHPRLKKYDYSQVGAYHINIHILPDAPQMSSLVNCSWDEDSIGYPRINLLYPGGLETQLTDFGKVCYEVVKELREKYPLLEIYTFVFMPTHIHLLLQIKQSTGLTVSDYVREIKSKATIYFNKQKNTPGQKYFQSSFYEHVIRGESDFIATAEYIDYNPKRQVRC